MYGLKKSVTSQKTEALRNEMIKLKNAITRVNQNWNDVVSQGIQSNQINNIVITCNTINSGLVGLATDIEADIRRIEDLYALSNKTASTGRL